MTRPTENSLKIAHKLVLMIILPLVFQLALLTWLLLVLNEAEGDRRAEERTVEILSNVNLVVNDTMKAARSEMMFKLFRRPEFRDEMYGIKSAMQFHINELKRLAPLDTVCSQSIQEFLAVLDSCAREFETDQESEQDNYGMETMKGAAKARALFHRIERASKIVVDKEMEARQTYGRNQSRNRELVQQIIVGLALGSLLFTVILMMLFSRGFANRLNILMQHALNIAINKPLGRMLVGSDELAQLDGVFFQLSNELAIARQHERAVIDNAALIICSLSDSLAITMINPAVERVLGFPAEDMTGKAVQSLFHEEDKETSYQSLQNCKNSGNPALFVARIKSSQGRYHFTEWAVRWSKEEKSLFCVVHDITERREAERLKQDVIAMVSHDLKAPLTSLSVTLDMLIEGILGDLNENGNRMMNNAQESVHSLILMINDLLDMERLESGAFNLAYEKVQCRELIDNAVDMVAPEASRRGLTIERNGQDLSADLDGERIRRVLVNLLSNAVKFSPRGTTISVGCTNVKMGDGNHGIEFSITDQGPGIPKDKVETIFDKFQQAGVEESVERTGSGLGLAICKAIIEAHRGQLGVKSEQGKGSTFWFRLP